MGPGESAFLPPALVRRTARLFLDYSGRWGMAQRQPTPARGTRPAGENGTRRYATPSPRSLDNRGLKAHGYRRDVATRQAFLRHVGVGELVTCGEEMCRTTRAMPQATVIMACGQMQRSIILPGAMPQARRRGLLH